VLLVTHAHVDHIGDAPAIAKMYKTKLYGPADMVTPLIFLGLIPADLGHRFNKSGSVKPAEGITVTAVKAEHSSLLVFNNPATGKPEAHPAGEAMGYIIQLENGFKVWHMGDTGLFPDMAIHRRALQARPRADADRRQFHDGSARRGLCGAHLGEAEECHPDALRRESAYRR
jgi:L-ascorbate metabolism protein UlaG (beta-lactamase superfamily)